MKEVFGMPLGDFIIALITGIATLVALFIGISTLIQSANLRKREYKARLLDEIKKWALTLLDTYVPNIPPLSEMMVAAKAGAPGEKARLAIVKAEVSVRRAKVLFEEAYIRELAKKLLINELDHSFNSIDTDMEAITFLTSKDAGTPFGVNPFNHEIVEKLEKELKDGINTPENLLNEYNNSLKLKGEHLLALIADTKAKLL